MKNKDERMKIMSEILNGIKVSSGVEIPRQLLHPSSCCAVPGDITPVQP